MDTQIRINYKEYPECMFAMIAAFLPSEEGDYLRYVSGKVFYRSKDANGNTYRNGLLHSYNDKPALVNGMRQEWYKNGKKHREHDKPAIIDQNIQEWFKNGMCHREGDLPAVIEDYNGEIYEKWEDP